MIHIWMYIEFGFGYTIVGIMKHLVKYILPPIFGLGFGFIIGLGPFGLTAFMMDIDQRIKGVPITLENKAEGELKDMGELKEIGGSNSISGDFIVRPT